MASPHAIALLLERAARRPPDELVEVVVEVAREVWAAEVVELLVATHEQTELVRLGSAARHAVGVDDDAPPGRCFTSGEVVSDGATTWAPVTHRGDRLGVLGTRSGGPAAAPGELAAYADVVALLLTAGRGCSDGLEVVRRTEEMTTGAELIASIVPPMSYADARVSVAAAMDPAYSSGGDALDHAVDGSVLRALILDATGHGFGASLVSAVAVAAHRSARRAGADLIGTWHSMDRFVGDANDDVRYATALLVELDLGTGRLAWVSAGHPPPVVLRADGQVVMLEAEVAPPLGTGLGGAPDLAEEYLEPGDVLLLHTDGITEARALDGRMLGLEGFVEMLRTELDRPGPLAERLRRIRLDLLARDDAWLADDATALLVQWHG